MKKIIFLILIIVNCQMAVAQKSLFTLNYDMTLPIGSTTDFISNYNFRGMNAQYRNFLTANAAIGFDIGYNAWYQKRSDLTYDVNNSTAITGTFYNFLRTWTLHVAGDYYFGDNSKQLKPYLGVGLGVNTVDLESYVVDYVVYDYGNWPFSISPELGLSFSNPRSTVTTNVSMYYNYTTYDLLSIVKNMGYIGFRLGIGWHD